MRLRAADLRVSGNEKPKSDSDTLDSANSRSWAPVTELQAGDGNDRLTALRCVPSKTVNPPSDIFLLMREKVLKTRSNAPLFENGGNGVYYIFLL